MSIRTKIAAALGTNDQEAVEKTLKAFEAVTKERLDKLCEDPENLGPEVNALEDFLFYIREEDVPSQMIH